MKIDLVREHNAFARILFILHTAAEAKTFYGLDKRSLFAAVIFNMQDLESYKTARSPYSSIMIAYVGPRSKRENAALYAALHRLGMMIIVAASPVDDKLPDANARADAYRKILPDGADVIETDRPAEIAAAISPS